jgi:arylsulfatase A-like enzyme/Flp pilus assembly protein TadD
MLKLEVNMKNPSRWSRLCPALLLLFFGIAHPVSPETAANPETETNVLLITVDTLRADRVSCYDPAHVKTPNIDALARRGTQFLQAYAHTPMTLPSHASILLGTTPVRHGVHDNGYFVVRPEHLSLAEHLKARGYRTAAFVSANPLDSRFGLAQGFDVYNDDFMPPGARKNTNAEQKADVAVAKALSWLEKAGPAKWFLWLHLYDPHAPYDPPEPFKAQTKERRYDGEVAFVDASLGKLFAALEKDGLNGRTIVILTADHGESLGEHGESTHGYFAYNPAIQVPLIIAAPGLKPRRSPEPAGHADLFPTVCDLLGMTIPEGLQGLSLRPAMDGKSLPSRRIYFESLSPYYALGWAPLTGYLENGQKFIESPIPEVYDLAADPGEKRNLAGGLDLGPFRENLGRLVKALSPSEAPNAQARPTSELKKRIESLGYLARPAGSVKREFGPEDDVKTMLPISNRIEAAFDLEKEGRIKEAISRLNGLVKEPKTLDTAYARLGELYLKEGNDAKAAEIIRAGLARFPSSFELLSDLADCLLTADKPDEVLRLIHEAHPSLMMEQDAPIWNTEGVAYLKLKDSARALESFRRAVGVDGEFVEAFSNLGSTALTLGLQRMDSQLLQEAIRALRKVTGLTPQDARAHNSLGAALYSAGQIDPAILSWEKALKLDLGLVRTNFFLGNAYLQKNNLPRALQYLEAYKLLAYPSLTPEEQRSLDLLILRCNPVKH